MEKLDISGMLPPQKALCVAGMVHGIVRKATDSELIEYLNKGIDDEGIDIEAAFAKYSTPKS
jgi:hypothetical protein